MGSEWSEGWWRGGVWGRVEVQRLTAPDWYFQLGRTYTMSVCVYDYVPQGCVPKEICQ